MAIVPDFFDLIEISTSTESSQKNWGASGFEEMDKEGSVTNELIQYLSKPQV